MKPGDKYICAGCGKEQTCTTPERAMWEEHHRNFPGMCQEEAVVVCDACYKRMVKEYPPKRFMRDRKRRTRG